MINSDIYDELREVACAAWNTQHQAALQLASACAVAGLPFNKYVEFVKKDLLINNTAQYESFVDRPIETAMYQHIHQLEPGQKDYGTRTGQYRLDTTKGQDSVRTRAST